VTTFTVKRGNVWGMRFVLTMPADPTFTFEGADITAELRSKPRMSGELLHTFAVVPIVSTDGKTAEFSLALSKAETLSVPDSYGDFRIERADPQFGPLNIYPYRLVMSDSGITAGATP
jgi:hypothetical protein